MSRPQGNKAQSEMLQIATSLSLEMRQKLDVLVLDQRPCVTRKGLLRFIIESHINDAFVKDESRLTQLLKTLKEREKAHIKQGFKYAK